MLERTIFTANRLRELSDALVLSTGTTDPVRLRRKFPIAGWRGRLFSSASWMLTTFHHSPIGAEARVMRQSSKHVLTVLVVFALALSGTLYGQTTKGTIAGVVTDAQGLVVSGAAVTAAAAEGGDVRSTTTGSNGEYRIESLNPGKYTVKVLAKGFAETQVRDVVVNASMITANNVELKITGGVETVTVEAGAETIQTESGELSKTIPQVDVKDLPYSSLNPYQLAVTLPGVMTVAGRDDATNGTAFAVNGLRPRANNFLIDGFDNNDNGIMGQAFQPQNTEAVQVVTFLTNAYAAEFGRGERFRVEPHVPQWFQYPSRLCIPLSSWKIFSGFDSVVRSSRTSCSSSVPRSGTASTVFHPYPR
jgi:hypothetical protein